MDKDYLKEQEENAYRFSTIKKKSTEGFEYKSFPGHQPAYDPDAESNKVEQFTTTTTRTFSDPKQQTPQKYLDGPSRWDEPTLQTYRERWSKTMPQDKERAKSTSHRHFQQHEQNLY